MRKIGVLVLAAATAMVLAVGSGAAVAASGSARDCAAQDGTYIKDGPDAICVLPEEKVSSPNANPNNNAQTTQSTTTGQGNLGNDPETVCDGPPGQCN
jgi:hypothetical protein